MKYILFFLIPFSVCSQTLPVSESNAYVYNKYNYGYDFFNLMGVYRQRNGELIVNEYAGGVYRLSNAFADEIPSSRKLTDSYIRVDRHTEYFCYPTEIRIFYDGKFHKTVPLDKDLYHTSFKYSDGILYFLSIRNNKASVLQSYSKGKIETIREFEARQWVEIHHGRSLYVCLVATDKPHFTFYLLKNRKLYFRKHFTAQKASSGIVHFYDENNFTLVNSDLGSIEICKKGKISVSYIKTRKINPALQPGYFSADDGSESIGYKLGDSLLSVFNTSYGDNIYSIVPNPESNSYYAATSTVFMRLFPHIKVYPRLFNRTNSNSVFTLQQDNKGKVWAGSYQGALSVIDQDQIKESKYKEYRFMNGGVAYKDKMLLFAESEKGMFLFDHENRFRKIADSVTCFYGMLSKKNVLYVGTFNYNGLWLTDASSLDKPGKPGWKKIDRSKGMKLQNIVTLCEDRFGNIWMGQQGIAVYNPRTGYCKTWSYKEKEIAFGSMASVLDTHQTLWFGTGKGELVYRVQKSEQDYSPENFKFISHPLLSGGKPISFIHQWKDFLILGAQDKVLLFDLKKWYRDKAVSVRYLNPMEAAFTNNTEQNTCFTDKKDGTVWFATSDKVYNWDIKKWLSLPLYKVRPEIIIKKDSTESRYLPEQNIEFKPRENSIDIQIRFQTPDNMPRYLNGILVKKGEKPVFTNPDLQAKFHFANLSAGDYIFYIRICQQDGSFGVFKYPLTIESFLWQKWWFWFLVSLFPLGFIYYYFENKGRINRHQKQIAQLNLNNLSNQFRPHFMLNALNSLGAELEDKPHANKVISRLGESINVMFRFAQTGGFTHSFENEMLMVYNTIEIQKLLYVSELETQVAGTETVPATMPVPIGLLQIPVENALLHGLRNREVPPYELDIEITESDSFYSITVGDNGVGREKAVQINHFKKNGKGLKNLEKMIALINTRQKDNISFEISDRKPEGTLVTIKIKKNIDYENFGV